MIDGKDALNMCKYLDEVRNRYQTLNGLIMLLLSCTPQTADKVDLDNCSLEIIDMNGQIIDKVLVIRKPAKSHAAEHDCRCEHLG